jgi:NDP-sugar pyrophosphorylase family protein
MPIGEFPILEVVVRQLKKHGFEHITMAVNHQADIIKAYFGDGTKWGIEIDYSQENESLGTMGPLNLISNLPENFLIMNGDILTDLNFKKFYDEHVSNGNIFSISSCERIQRVDYGVLKVNNLCELICFTEKPRNSYLVSMGVYMANKSILKSIPKSFYGFDDLMYNLISRGDKICVRQHDGYWLDIGRPDDYMQAIEEFDELRKSLL